MANNKWSYIMRDLADFKCYLQCRLEIAKQFLRQEVKPGSPEDSEQWMIRGRMLELDKLLEKMDEIKDDCLDEAHRD